MECCPRNGQQLELSCIYLLNGYITEGTQRFSMRCLLLASFPGPAQLSITCSTNIVVLLISCRGWEWCESLSPWWLNMIKPTILKRRQLDRKLSFKNFSLLLQCTTSELWTRLETICHRSISVISIWWCTIYWGMTFQLPGNLIQLMASWTN